MRRLEGLKDIERFCEQLYMNLHGNIPIGFKPTFEVDPGTYHRLLHEAHERSCYQHSSGFLHIQSSEYFYFQFSAFKVKVCIDKNDFEANCGPMGYGIQGSNSEKDRWLREQEFRYKRELDLQMRRAAIKMPTYKEEPKIEIKPVKIVKPEIKIDESFAKDFVKKQLGDTATGLTTNISKSD